LRILIASLVLTIQFLGAERAARQYPFRSLVDAGAPLACGSDWSVSSPNPFLQMETAVTRVGPEAPNAEPFLPDERLDLATALAAFTIGSAYVNHLDEITGSIEVGKFADLAVVDRDLFAHPVDEMYRAAGFEWVAPEGRDLAECCDLWAGLPLLFEPGSEWNYSVASDVLGRVVEVVSGQPLDRYFAERIFGPLGMADTGFWVEQADAGDLAALYMAGPGGGLARHDDLGGRALRRPACLAGGGGLVSTAADYHRFTQALLGGGELDGARLLGSRTLAYMARNHLPGGADLESFGRRLFAETTFDGVGYGLGFAVLLDPVANKVLSTPGELAWGGAASTFFWVDPAEQLTAIFLTQLAPSTTYPLRSELRQLVYQALVD
jgi:hypothetical protein